MKFGYKVTFEDEVQGQIEEMFETYPEAQDFWDEYADTETCTSGKMTYLPTNEVIWEF